MNDDVLRGKAAELFPQSEHLQNEWVDCVVYLRTRSKCGYAIDKSVDKGKESSVLKGYTAPDRPKMPETVDHFTLPDEQVIPRPRPDVYAMIDSPNVFGIRTKKP